MKAYVSALVSLVIELGALAGYSQTLTYPPVQLSADDSNVTTTSTTAYWSYIQNSGTTTVIAGAAGNQDGKYHKLTTPTSTASLGAIASFYTALPESGVYQVEMWWPKTTLNPQAKVTVNYSSYGRSISCVKSISQATLGGQWNPVGLFSFEKAKSPKVVVSVTAANGSAALIDGIRFVKVDPKVDFNLSNSSPQYWNPKTPGWSDKIKGSGWTNSDVDTAGNGTQLAVAANATNGSKILLRAAVPYAGRYRLYFKWPNLKKNNRSKRTAVEVYASQNDVDLGKALFRSDTIDQMSMDETGKWNFLGSCSIPSDLSTPVIVVRNDDDSGSYCLVETARLELATDSAYVADLANDSDAAGDLQFTPANSAGFNGWQKLANKNGATPSFGGSHLYSVLDVYNSKVKVNQNTQYEPGPVTLKLRPQQSGRFAAYVYVAAEDAGTGQNILAATAITKGKSQIPITKIPIQTGTWNTLGTVTTFTSSETLTLTLKHGDVKLGPNGSTAALASTVNFDAVRLIPIAPVDSNENGVDDDIEAFYFGSDWRNHAGSLQSDADGLSDADELLLGTNPLVTDSDGDGVLDGDEDADLDGMLNKWELDHHLSPIADDAWGDRDGDGYPNYYEFRYSSDPSDKASVPTTPYTVCASGGAAYTKIQDAINAAVGDYKIVQVKAAQGGPNPGVYGERLVIQNRKMLLIGVEGAYKVTVDAGGTGSALTAKSDTWVSNMTFQNGGASDGAGILGAGANIYLVNVVVKNSHAQGSSDPATGSSMSFAGSKVTIVNSSIFDNASKGPVVQETGGTLTAYNSIFWNPMSSGGELGGDSLYISYSLVRGGFEGEVNVNQDPELTPDGHLTADSPCRNAGVEGDASPHLDFDNEARVDEGGDVGVDEFIDSDGDGMPDWWENANGFIWNDPSDGIGDPDGDGSSNRAEYENGSDPHHLDQMASNGDDAGDPSINDNRQLAVGYTNGSAAVDQSGAANYTIPIAVSPGTAGMQPKLAFNYSSRGGNGIMGMGWSLSGLSGISRAPASLAPDGFVDGIDFDLADRFALDGNRLMVVAGKYGEAGSEYRTEIDSFVKVMAYGQAGAGPQYFKAWTKAGLVYTYGDESGPPNAGMIAQAYVGKSSAPIASWPVSKIEDSAKNFMTFTYTQYPGRGELLLKSINYTGNTALLPYASVNFRYKERPDPLRSYVSGSLITMTQRLDEVVCQYGTQLVRQYNLKYETGAATGRLRLTGITEGTQNLKFNSNVFTWDLNSGLENLTHQKGSSRGGYSGREVWMQGDFNQDGLTDIAEIRNSHNIDSNAIVEVSLAQRDAAGAVSFGDPQTWSDKAIPFRGDDRWIQGDFDGDGRVDVARFFRDPIAGGASISMLKNNGHGGFDAIKDMISKQGPIENGTRVFPMDANGDGKLDIVTLTGSDSKGISGEMNVSWYKHNDNETYSRFKIVVDKANDVMSKGGYWFVGDFTGDGITELAEVRPDNEAWNIYMFKAIIGTNGDLVGYTKLEWAHGEGKLDTKWATGDFNGDGITDFLATGAVQSGTASLNVLTSTGKGLIKKAWGALTGIQLKEKLQILCGDFNGDHRADVFALFEGEPINTTPPPPPTPTPTDAAWTTPSPTASCAVSVRYSCYYSTHAQVFAAGNSGAYQDSYSGFTVDPSESSSNGVSVTANMDQPASILVQNLLCASGDFNGDGKEDFARIAVRRSKHFSSNEIPVMGSFHFWTGSLGLHEVIQKIDNGLDSAGKGSVVKFEYTTLADANVYANNNQAQWPQIDLMASIPVVSHAIYATGRQDQVGNPETYKIRYLYNDLRAHPKRGLQGFGSVVSIDSRTGMMTKTFYQQTFPYTGMIRNAITYKDSSGSILLNQTSNDAFNDILTYSKVHYPYVVKNTAYARNLDGSLIYKTVTTYSDVNEFGEVKDLLVATSDGFSKRTVSLYDQDDVTAWKLGRVGRTTVISTTPSGTSTRTSGFNYNNAGMLRNEQIESGVDGLSTTYEYDSFGNSLVATSSGRSDYQGNRQDRVNRTYFDGQGRLIVKALNALSQVETCIYDDGQRNYRALGLACAVTGPNNLTTKFIFDEFGRKTGEIGANDVSTVIEYAWPNPSHKVTGEKFHVTTSVSGRAPQIVYYDALGREICRESQSGVDELGASKVVVSTTSYDVMGRKNKTSLPYFSGVASVIYSETEYDLLGRVKTQTEPGETADNVTTFAYDGFSVTSTNAKAQKTVAIKNSQGQLLHSERSTANGSPSVTDYQYDAFGKLETTTDALGNKVVMHYDVRGRKTSMDDPDMGHWDYGYNAFGELVWQKDAKQQVAEMHYDLLGRMVDKTEPEGVTYWTYDTATGKGIGKLAKVSSDNYSRMLDYDQKGRLSAQTERINGKAFVSKTTYDTLSRPETFEYPSGFKCKNVYDSNGFLQKVNKADDAVTYWQALAYDASGHVKKEKLGNGVITNREYAPETGFLKTIVSGVQGGGSAQNLSYTWDILGNLKTRTDKLQALDGNNAITETFEYDDLNRLKSALIAGRDAQTVDYDRLGNITFKSDVGSYEYTSSSNPYGYSMPHAVKTVKGMALNYDANGNTTSDGSRTITWTSFNMPVRIAKGNVSSVFDYDAEHNRLCQTATVAGATTVTTYLGGGLYEEVQSGLSLDRKHYISSPGGLVSVLTQNLAQGTATFTENTRYPLKDHLGSIDTITNEMGQVTERYSYDAWGKRRTTDWRPSSQVIRSEATNRGFTGHEMLDDLGLVHMNGRVYNPELGRFLSADPFNESPGDPLAYNRYTYVGNHPLSLTDPSGYFSWGAVIGAIVAVVAGVVTAGIALYAYGLVVGAGWAGAATIAAAGATSFTTGIVAGAGFGFGAAFAGTLYAGGSAGQALQAGLIGAVVGGVSGGLAFEIGAVAQSIDGFGGSAFQVGAHAVLGGSLNAAEGGDFYEGALSAGVSAGFSPVIGSIGGENGGAWGEAGRVAAAAVVGGTAAKLGGGKFENGAVTAAFMRLYNDEAKHNKIEKLDVNLSKHQIQGFDKEGKVVFESEIVSGNDADPATKTSRGTFTLGDWQKDKVSPQWGKLTKTPWSKSFLGRNAYGPYFVPIRGSDGEGLHGTMGFTNGTWGIAKALYPTSHGCVRVPNWQIIRLHDELIPNSRGVKITLHD